MYTSVKFNTDVAGHLFGIKTPAIQINTNTNVQRYGGLALLIQCCNYAESMLINLYFAKLYEQDHNFDYNIESVTCDYNSTFIGDNYSCFIQGIFIIRYKTIQVADKAFKIFKEFYIHNIYNEDEQGICNGLYAKFDYQTRININHLTGPVEIIAMQSDLEGLGDSVSVEGLNIKLTKKESEHFFSVAKLRQRFTDYILDRFEFFNKKDEIHVLIPLCVFTKMYHLPGILLQKDYVATLRREDQDSIELVNKIHSLIYTWREQMVDEVMVIAKLKKDYT